MQKNAACFRDSAWYSLKQIVTKNKYPQSSLLPLSESVCDRHSHFYHHILLAQTRGQ
jgi:hypothetical protein